MYEFSPDDARRSNAWQNSYAVSARRSDRIARIFAVVMVASSIAAVVIAPWSR